jgi:chromate transporter
LRCSVERCDIFHFVQSHPMQTPPELRPSPVSLKQAFWYWLKLGFVSFGGPAGQIALMHAELVERRRWISERRFLHALNYCMLLPGPEATQLAAYMGWLMHGTRGGIMAGALFLLPSLLILMLLSWIYMVFGSLPVIAAILYGIKPAVVAIVLAAAWRIGTRTLRNASLIAVAVAAFLAISALHLPFPLVVLSAAIIGWAGARWRPDAFHIGGQQPGSSVSYGLALIDDDTPTPQHALFSWTRLLRTGGIGIALGLAGWLLVAALSEPADALRQMTWFFTKAALMTFGGAYAVLPYVYQGGVEHFHWLTATQMIDGLALGETTPGPLIMIVAFVGFVGAWSNALAGESLLAAGVAGASVAAFFTFLPSFIFILAGGPLVESTRDNLKMTAPLTAISAAVVGVIVSLALFFGQHVFWLTGSAGANGASGRWDLAAIAITFTACIALFKFKVGPIKLIFACAIAGLVLS